MEGKVRTPKNHFPSNHHHHHHHHDQKPTIQSKPTLQPFTERVTHALQHHLLLLYRSDPEFYILGATKNVYLVNITITPSCTCPDRITPCKHILFVLIKVLGLPLDDPSLKRQNLNPCLVERLRDTPSSPTSIACQTLRQRFHQLFILKKELGLRRASLKPCMEVETGATCPICLEEMGRSGDRLVACDTCRIPIHEECLMNWKRLQRNGSTKCVTCRSHWKGSGQERYFNLANYATYDEMCLKTKGHNACHHE